MPRQTEEHPRYEMPVSVYGVTLGYAGPRGKAHSPTGGDGVLYLPHSPSPDPRKNRHA